MKMHITLTLDTEVITALSIMDLNVSGLVNDFLKNYLSDRLTNPNKEGASKEDLVKEAMSLQTQLIVKQKAIEQFDAEEKTRKEKELNDYMLQKKKQIIHIDT